MVNIVVRNDFEGYYIAIDLIRMNNLLGSFKTHIQPKAIFI